MAYSVDDIAELIEYHLVACAPEDADADMNLGQLRGRIERLMSRRNAPSSWAFCDTCGCTVYEEVFADDGSNFTPDGGFYCSDHIPGRHRDDWG